nr:unnamed protein product [Callosobruchus analis]
MSTYLPPENVKAFVPITINPEVKVAIQEKLLNVIIRVRIASSHF